MADGLEGQHPDGGRVMARALAIWPGLDRRRLRRSGGDPGLVARLVERRTVLTRDAIIRMLVGDGSSGAEAGIEPGDVAAGTRRGTPIRGNGPLGRDLPAVRSQPTERSVPTEAGR